MRECDPLATAKSFLRIWLLVRDPENIITKQNHPTIKSFWDIYQKAAKVTFTNEQKKEIFREKFKK